MEFYARAWNLERIQMQKGMFLGSMFATHTPRIQLMRTPYSHGVLLQGDFPKGTILIAAVTTKADVVFQNKQAEKHEIKILQSGDEIDFLSNGESETFTLAVEEEFFHTAYHAYFGTEFTSCPKDKRVYITPHFFSHFILGIGQWMDYLMQGQHNLHLKTQYEHIEREILHHVFSCIHIEEDSKPRQKYQISKVRDLLHYSIEAPVNIDMYAQELGISQRLLHHSFKENYGFTPKKYLLSLRMHKVKQSLLLCEPEKTTISSIIGKYAFFNHSTFTQAYKQMFGESPSDTFKKR